MLKTKTQKITVIFILILICIFLISIYQKKPNRNPNRQDLLKTKQVLPVNNIAFLEVSGVKYETSIQQEISVYDFMQKLKDERKIDFESKNYTGIGKFIESINEVKNGDKSWVYYVNNKKAEIGVSNYKIKNRDIVSWKYENSY